jgi:hypothetical protein
MAMSDYDALAFDHKGKPCIGVLKGFEGQAIELYKNWAYVRDERMWHENGGYVKPTIAQVWEGHINLAGLDIYAVRGPQRAIFLFAVTCKWDKVKEKATYRWMGGIACDGYTDPIPALVAKAGANPDDYKEFWRGSSFGGGEESTITLTGLRKEGGSDEWEWPESECDASMEPQWVGVTPETLEAFFQWLEKLHAEKDPFLGSFRSDRMTKWIAKIRAAKAMRFNQGDAYLGSMLKCGFSATEVGGEAPAEPMAIQMIKGMSAS